MDFDPAGRKTAVLPAAGDAAPTTDRHIANGAPIFHPWKLGLECFLAIRAIGRHRILIELSLGRESHQPLGLDKTGKHAHRERAAAEAEHPDAIGFGPTLGGIGFMVVVTK